MPLTQRALIELIAVIATIAVLLALTYQVIAPFLVALAWAGILVLVTWAPFERLARLVRSRWLAATLIVLAIGSVLVVPLVFAGIELSSRIDAIGNWYQQKMATYLRGQTRLSCSRMTGRCFPGVVLISCEKADLPKLAGRKVESDP